MGNVAGGLLACCWWIADLCLGFLRWFQNFDRASASFDGVGDFSDVFWETTYYEADLTDDLGVSVDRAAGILSSGTLEKTELSTGTLQEGWVGLAGWVGWG